MKINRYGIYEGRSKLNQIPTPELENNNSRKALYEKISENFPELKIIS